MTANNHANGLHRTGTIRQTTGPSGVRSLQARNVNFPTPLQLVHAEYAIKLTLDGRGAPLRYRGREYAPCSVGDISLFVPYEPVVSSASAGSTSFISLLVEPEIVRSACRTLGYSGDISSGIPHQHHGDVVREMTVMNKDITAGIPPTAEAVASILEHLLDQRNVNRPVPVSNTVHRLREIILDRLAENVSLDRLEQECGLSRFHLVRMFRRHYGMPPHEFHIRARVAKACTLLAKGTPQAEVAQTVGFFDQSHLHRHFRRIRGMSPGAFQDAVRRDAARRPV